MMMIMTGGTMTTTTNEQDVLFRKAVRVRSLTDPLGAMGFRVQSQRVRKETRLRRLVFAMTTLGFVGILAGVIAASPPQPVPENPTGPITVAETRRTQDGRVIAESAQSSQQQPTHTRTRGS